MSHYPETNQWQKCRKCGAHLHESQWAPYFICPNCQSYKRLTAMERIAILADEHSFEVINVVNQTQNKAEFPGYTEKLERAKSATTSDEAVVVGIATINKQALVLAVMDSFFMMGSLNTTAGARIKAGMKVALDQKLPFVIVTASGGARMQEGIYSLLQMNSILYMKQKLDDAGLLVMSLLTDPTMGGVSASFALNNDIVLAEKQAKIGFAGERVIKKTTNEKLPIDFQTAEGLYSNGFIDQVIDRKNLKQVISQLLTLHA
ncbi:acetyl-CoA carboxylase carboxyltransferase subunit beta [Dellaglioa carnosa]|uniref:Acetyl-CoA carboxyl transferase n=1 Tax=Dellaglioa carnosa TaxID=2995136 RepID=A0ABT4JN65_9LACO|nr:acetyl-CoA carboxylase carboxyltransferase subunit beta [Dellaglioa carnosa]MCZ2491792.1 acetyl-CoA carboxyl transferase [Dellaglioa carnosa]MCZ2494808.1 acetyl-CoA carboxyl transferase [Dellaglioa carnosa]MDK1731671.1 acetyl-CoA carboxyl transferase [Dellaglioa carnosa]